MTKRPGFISNRLLWGLVCLAVLAGGYYVWAAKRTNPPAYLAKAGAAPTDIQWKDGAWYWLEGAGTPASRLMRANAGDLKPVAAASGISAYSVAGGKLAWNAKEGNQWTISVASFEGSDKRVLWTGAREPKGICLIEDRVYWLEDLPPSVPKSGPLPPLDASVQMVSMSLSANGGQPVITPLLEAQGAQVLGARDGQVYVVAQRPTPLNVTTIYRIGLKEGTAHRLVGETGQQSALLTKEGVLYWTAPSREAADTGTITCIRRLSKEEKPETLDDWMPPRGHLFETDKGIYYIDGANVQGAWPVTGQRALPRAVPVPANYAVLAAGGHDLLLLQNTESLTPTYPLYRMPLP